MLLLFPFGANQPLEFAVAQIAAFRAVEDDGFDLFDNRFFMRGAEMPFNLFHGGKFKRLGHVQAGVLGFEALFFNPFFDDGLVFHDFYAGFKDVERHFGEAFGVQFAQLILIIVIVGWAQNDAAHAALGNKGVGAFGRVSGRAFGLIKSAEMVFKNVGNGFVFRKPGESSRAQM